MFSPAEAAACDRLIQMALEEDLGDVGDLTCQAIIPSAQQGRAVFAARSPGVLAGVEAAGRAMKAVYSGVVFEPLLSDGSSLNEGSQIAVVEGPIRSILIGERTALNFLQHLSGIATLTRRYVDAVAGLSAQIFDTRKTTPGWRLLEKYAVRQGGGHNHRMGLYDGVLIKDNHLAALAGERNPIARAVEAARTHTGGSVPIEIEVDNLEQFEEALACRPDIILLDNMHPSKLREAVELRDSWWAEEADLRWLEESDPIESYGPSPSVLLEASGGVTLQTVRAIAETGVDRISVGALTHSAPALDIALDYVQ
jgi:nicotinate-nucleotide pyrophosphorylase (carboxylating)